jgi:hypothetical protein
VGLGEGLLGTGSQWCAVTDREVGGTSPLWREGVYAVIARQIWGGSSWCHEIRPGWFWRGFLNI